MTHAAPDPWEVRHRDPDAGGPDYGELLDAMRELQDRFVAADPPRDQTLELAATVRSLAAQFAMWAAPEHHQPAGMRNDLPGRGSALPVPAIIEEETDTCVRGRVTFRRFHLGGNGAAHGGTVPLFFDDVLGRLSNGVDRRVARTAYLHTNYRRITRSGGRTALRGDGRPHRGPQALGVGPHVRR